MLTLLCVLVATVPFAVVFGLLEWTNRRARRRREIQARQIALTDGVHERLGAAVAPVVSHRRGVPFERPALIEALLASVLEVFAPRDGRSLKIVLTRQAEPQATKRGGRDVRLESLPWT
jgi:hypothetical protein